MCWPSRRALNFLDAGVEIRIVRSLQSVRKLSGWWAGGPPFRSGGRLLAVWWPKCCWTKREGTQLSEELTERVAKMIEPSIEAMGFDLVRVSFGGGERSTLQIMIERTDLAELTVEHCADVSRAASAILDVEDPISGEYQLEVSSPGIDRPLTRFGDYERFAGFEAKVELARGIDGRKRFRGRLMGVEGEELVVVEHVEGDPWRLPFHDIRSAKLVMTDELLKAAESGAA